MKNRKPGFYWVFYNGEWVVARFWDDEIWTLSGAEVPFYDAEFDTIDEEQLYP